LARNRAGFIRGATSGIPVMNGLLLGLSSGTACFATCAPVVLPYLVAEGKSIRRTAPLMTPFLAGRFAGYLAFAVIAWGLGLALTAVAAGPHAAVTPHVAGASGALPAAAHPRLFSWLGALRIFLGSLMILYAWRGLRSPCAGESGGRVLKWLGRPAKAPMVYPGVLGFLTGINLCPPFFAAVVEAARSGSLGGSLLYFAAFFLGTSVYLLPLPLLGAARRHAKLRLVARLTAGVVGFLYALSGVTVLAA
jgi:sulfite exporter TauE/SafE